VKRTVRLGVMFALIGMAAACGGKMDTPTSPSGSAPAGALVALADVTLGLDVTSGQIGTFNYAGQSATAPAGTFDHVTFQFYTFQKTPAAFGTLYLLDREFLGLPTDLSPAMPGFIARSESNTGGVYVFAPEVTLEGGKQYWFYTDTQGSFASSFDTDLYSGGDLYVTGINSFPFHKASASGRMVGNTYVPPPAGVFLDANFKLQGRQKGASQ
jgi:hypothetical protein